MKIDADTLEVIAGARTEAKNLYLDERMDRRSYEKVAKALEAVGGKWNRRAGAFLFECDAEDALAGLAGGEVVTARDKCQFFTPPALAETVASKLKLVPSIAPDLGGLSLLEPSAGRGALLAASFRWAKDNRCPIRATAVESDPELARLLRAARWGYCDDIDVIEEDFLDFAERARADGREWDRIAMNPPFRRNSDARHILAASRLLAVGGRLVSIATGGLLSRNDAISAEVRRLVEEHGGAEKLPPRSFKSAGTDIETTLLWIDRRVGVAGKEVPV